MGIDEIVTGTNSVAVKGTATGKDSAGVKGTALGQDAYGVIGEGEAVGAQGVGNSWHGVKGISKSTIGGHGVYGENTAGGTGVCGKSKGAHAVVGINEGTTGGFGVYGEAVGTGVAGVSKKWIGVYGETAGVENGPAGVWGEHKGTGTGVKAISKDGVGLFAFSSSNEAIHADTNSLATAAIAAYNSNAGGDGAAVFAKKVGPNGHAGFFDGNVWVTGELGVAKDITLANADCAEDFDVCEVEEIEPGTVVVLGLEGVLRSSSRAYDKRVAGVISGAGEYKPGIVLDKQHSRESRLPVALLGKVFCKVDATHAEIDVGDLLTTSETPGHAMKVIDQFKAFGTVIGKALRPHTEGKGLIPILIALQ